MIRSKGNRRAVTFDPGLDTLLASITAVMMIGIYYLNAKYGFEQPAVFFIGFVGIGHLLLDPAPGIPAMILQTLSIREDDTCARADFQTSRSLR